jgi:hypothetical protein
VLESLPKPAIALPTPHGRAASAGAWARERLTTTPGRLVLLTVLVVAGAVSFGVIASLAERSRAQAANGVRTQTEPLLVQSVFLYTALSDANATATTTFLQGGLEPPARRAQYLADLRLASDALATLTREAGGASDVGAAVRSITERLPIYSGLVESARADNRQGFPVGAAYLREASALLTGQILPQANRLYATEAERLSDDYDTGAATASLVVLVIVAVLVLGVLVGGQAYVARASRRIINVPMLVATVVLAAVSVWAVVGVIDEQDALAQARGDSDSVELLSASRVLLARARSDEALTLANRGSDETDPVDFTVVMGTLGSVLKEAGAGTTSALDVDFAAYRAETNRIAALEQSGQISAATKSGSSSAAAPQLDADLSTRVTAAQGRFTSAAADATSSLSGLAVAIPLLAVVAGALAVFGLWLRLGEYR